MAAAMPTETNPTASEPRAPYSMRESTSRPSWSVPSGWARLGPSNMFRSAGRWGSQGASTGASSASANRQSTTTPPAMASRFFVKARQKYLRASPSSPVSAEADSGIHEPVGEVGTEIGDEGQGGDDHEVAHDHRVVALEDRLHHELAHAGNREDGLDDHAAADESGQRQAEDRDQRQHGVP